MIPKPLIDSYISHEEIFLVNNVLRKYSDTKKEMRRSETSVEYAI